MKRRNFVGAMLSSVALAGLSSNFARASWLGTPGTEGFSTEEMLAACKKHFDSIFYMENVDLNRLPEKGLIILTDSYELKANPEKNSVFDLAELIIERAKPLDFNAEALRDGKIPDGMDVYSTSISVRTNGILCPLMLTELKAYDVEVVYKKPITINYRLPFKKVMEEENFEYDHSNAMLEVYQGKDIKARVFKGLDDISRNFIVDSIEPVNIYSADDLNQPAFCLNIFSKLVSENFRQILLS